MKLYWRQINPQCWKGDEIYCLYHNKGDVIWRVVHIYHVSSSGNPDGKKDAWRCSYPVSATKDSQTMTNRMFKTLDEAKKFGKEKFIEYLKKYPEKR